MSTRGRLSRGVCLGRGAVADADVGARGRHSGSHSVACHGSGVEIWIVS